MCWLEPCIVERECSFLLVNRGRRALHDSDDAHFSERFDGTAYEKDQLTEKMDRWGQWVASKVREWPRRWRKFNIISLTDQDTKYIAYEV
mmetsp:Transcript_13324/g.32344  ORF Transcript_13324/g.32344 Transcript_13324/m.32344 type:complete len:90 (-) Transcript_13324:142-411(-)